MYILQNAVKNIFRNKGRNILIAAIIFAIIATTVVALIINNTSNNVIESYKDRFSSEVSISPDMEKIRQEAMKNAAGGRIQMKRPEIAAELLLSFTKSECLKESVVYAGQGGSSDDIRAIDQDDSSDSGSNNNRDRGITASPGGVNVMMGPAGGGNFSLYGDYWQDFNDGNRSLDEDEISRMPNADNECVVSKDLAEENSINVGDSITFTGTFSRDIPDDIDVGEKKEDDTVIIDGIEYKLAQGMGANFRAIREAAYELKVVGIYVDLTDDYANPDMPKNAFMNRRNEVITTLDTLLNARKTNEDGLNVEAVYYLKSPDMIGQFSNECYSQGLSDQFRITTDEASYKRIIDPVEGMKKFSMVFMFVVIGLGAIILLLLSSISIRERKYEIGVLRAMGMKKGKVALGLWSEILIITCACLVIGIGAGAAAAQPVTDSLLKSQVEAAEKAEQQNFAPQGRQSGGGPVMQAARIPGGGMMGRANVKPLSEMDINIGIGTILEIIGIALLLASSAGLLSISKITKYEPIKILMERN